MSKTLGNNDEVLATEPVLYSDEEMVTVADFPDPATAHMARMALEAAGIPVFLQGENANNLLPIAFGARVMVRPQDEAAARTVLTEFEAAPVSFEQVAEAESADEMRQREGIDAGEAPERR